VNQVLCELTHLRLRHVFIEMTVLMQIWKLIEGVRGCVLLPSIATTVPVERGDRSLLA